MTEAKGYEPSREEIADAKEHLSDEERFRSKMREDDYERIQKVVSDCLGNYPESRLVSIVSGELTKDELGKMQKVLAEIAGGQIPTEYMEKLHRAVVDADAKDRKETPLPSSGVPLPKASFPAFEQIIKTLASGIIQEKQSENK